MISVDLPFTQRRNTEGFLNRSKSFAIQPIGPNAWYGSGAFQHHHYIPKDYMKSQIKSILAVTVTAIALATAAFNVHAQFKMDSAGKINKSSGATAGKIDSDGKTISGPGGETLGKVSSDGKSISNKNGVTVLKISGTTLSNANGATVGTMSDVTRSISGAKAEPKYAALWWFVVKGNK